MKQDPWLWAEDNIHVAGPLPIKVRCRRADDRDAMVIDLALRTRDRSEGTDTQVRLYEYIDAPWCLTWTRADVQAKILAMCHQLYTHELEEQFRVEGERPYDPHAKT